MTRQREALGYSKQRLSFTSQVPASTISQIESRRFTPYEPQLRRIAAALGWESDARELLAEVVEKSSGSTA
jgi:ribosome-binding protein aMBF1 (putative translation factor)